MGPLSSILALPMPETKIKLATSPQAHLPTASCVHAVRMHSLGGMLWPVSYGPQPSRSGRLIDGQILDYLMGLMNQELSCSKSHRSPVQVRYGIQITATDFNPDLVTSFASTSISNMQFGFAKTITENENRLR